MAAVGFGVVSGGGGEEGEEMVMMGSGGEGSVMAGNLATSHNTSHDIDTREESVGGGGGREESRDMFEETNDEEEVEEAEDVNLVDLEEEDVKAGLSFASKEVAASSMRRFFAKNSHPCICVSCLQII